MTKLVYNACFGGFSLSDAALTRYAELKGITVYPEESRFGGALFWLVPKDDRTPYSDTLSSRDFNRTDPALVQVVEELGPNADGNFAELQIIDLPAGTAYRIDEYDGLETVETRDGIDWNIA